jgi:alanyl-tRNA synthetase
MSGDDIRGKFLSFFETKDHTVFPSASLVPVDDPTILWINCGMAPFKPYFEERVAPPNRKLASSQKSIRTNDIENVGRTPRHHTFFEMLGNFSIGDYFKEDSIAWAWELVTGWFRLPEDLLYVTVHPTDDEARQIWRRKIGLPATRVVDDPSNFWDIGPGPCGPNSEIYIDRGARFGCGRPDCRPSCDCSRYLEFWNLVFTQFSHNSDGTHTPLPKKNIDTGMGLERMASIMQDVDTNFDTDLLFPIIKATMDITGRKYGGGASSGGGGSAGDRSSGGGRHHLDQAFCIIADHVRALTLAISDGALPSNEGRGYILRRLLRRAARYGRSLGVEEPFLHTLVGTVAGIFAAPYPELAKTAGHVARVIHGEEERFGATLSEGLRIATTMIARAKGIGGPAQPATAAPCLPGDQAFLLYDTYGFPLDLTEDVAAEHGLSVDRDGFARAMAEQRDRARAARQTAGWDSSAAFAEAVRDLAPTEFVGYDLLEAEGTVLAILKDGEPVSRAQTGAQVQVILNRTTFYPEGGGQVGDAGRLTVDATSGAGPGTGVAAVLRVETTRRTLDGKILHLGGIESGEIAQGNQVRASVDADRRLAVARNHTATHLLHRALRLVLGDHAAQAGSLVTPDRLRFDFAHFAAPSADELRRAETMVNERILDHLPVVATEMSLEEARAAGAVALFGEKYGERVRVISMRGPSGDFSIELCGGVHLRGTSEVGLFKILSEGSVGAGLRRIEAVTGLNSLHHVREVESTLEAVASDLRAGVADVPARVRDLLADLKARDRELESLRAKLSRHAAEDLLADAREVGGARIVAGRVVAPTMDLLRAAADAVKARLGSGVIILGSVTADGDKVNLVAMVTADLVGRGVHAGDIIKETARAAGGGGGGRPDMAQAGGKEPLKLDEALARGRAVAEAQLLQDTHNQGPAGTQ